MTAFTGTVGTVDPPLFGVFKPWASTGETEHTLTTGLPGMGAKRAYGTEAEVKRQAEDWLGGHVASLGAVFPGGRRAGDSTGEGNGNA
jgi:hypothetical protein